MSTCHILGENSCCQTILAGVAGLDDVGLVLELGDGCHGPKDLLLYDLHFFSGLFERISYALGRQYVMHFSEGSSHLQKQWAQGSSLLNHVLHLRGAALRPQPFLLRCSLGPCRTGPSIPVIPGRSRRRKDRQLPSPL